MTKEFGGKSLILGSDALPAAANVPRPNELGVLERKFERLREVTQLVRDSSDTSDLEIIQKRIDCGEHALADKSFGSLREHVANVSRPATCRQIAECISLLVACFPGNREPVFGRLICVDVGELQPSAWALQSACNVLRRTSKFMPAIIEVREAVKLAERRLRQARADIGDLPKWLEKAKANRSHQIEVRESQIAEIFSRWDRGKGIGYGNYHPSVIEEATRRYEEKRPGSSLLDSVF
jgi:hypothetical protein